MVSVRADLAGRIRVHRRVSAGEYSWQVTTDHRATAERLTADVGAQATATDGGWAATLSGPLLRVMAATGPRGSVVVSLAAAPDAGFVLALPTWQTAHVCNPAVWAMLREHAGTALSADLTVCPIDVSTRGGRLVRYAVPKLTLSVAAVAG